MQAGGGWALEDHGDKFLGWVRVGDIGVVQSRSQPIHGRIEAITRTYTWHGGAGGSQCTEGTVQI